MKENRYLISETTKAERIEIIKIVDSGNMQTAQIIDYFSTDNKEYWLSKVKECDWGAGQYLCKLLKDEKLKQLVGENTEVIAMLESC